VFLQITTEAVVAEPSVAAPTGRSGRRSRRR
jgi:hypothetical protein